MLEELEVCWDLHIKSDICKSHSLILKEKEVK
jgi:hypothetical protein